MMDTADMAHADAVGNASEPGSDEEDFNFDLPGDTAKLTAAQVRPCTLDNLVVHSCAGQEKSRIPPKPTSEKTTFMLDFFPN